MTTNTIDPLQAKLNSLVDEVAEVDSKMQEILRDKDYTNDEGNTFVELKKRWVQLTKRIWAIKQNWEG
jgi:hypothetical protein